MYMVLLGIVLHEALAVYPAESGEDASEDGRRHADGCGAGASLSVLASGGADLGGGGEPRGAKVSEGERR